MNKELDILLLEDDAADAELSLRELRREGIQCRAKRVWTEADFATALQQPALDLILADYALPAYDGLTALKRAQQERPEVPFILVSGSLGEELAIDALHHGATDYVLKRRLSRLGPAVRRALLEIQERRQRQQAEAALAKSEARYRGLFESSRDAIMTLFPPDWKFTSANAATVELFGAKDQQQFTSLGPWEVSPARQPDGEDSSTKAKRMIETAMTRGSHFFEWTHQRLDGQAFPATVLLTRVQLEGKAGLQATVRDITEQKQAEAALRESEAKFRSVAETSPVGILIHQGGRFRYVNAVLVAMTGYTREELLAMDFLELVHPEFRGLVGSRGLARLRGEEVPANYEFKVLTKAGEERWAELRATGFEFEGQPAVLATVFDITEQKRAGEQIRAQASLLDLAHDAIAVQDMNGQIRYWNKAFERLTGRTAAEALGKDMTALLRKDAAAVAEATDALLAQGEWNGELDIVTSAGRRLTTQSRWSLMRDAQGQPEAVLTINTDITAKKQLEAQFLRAQRLESLGFLASGIAHDLNNALAPIPMAVDLLRGEPLDQQGQKLLDTVTAGVSRATGMVQQIITFARGIEGKRIRLRLQHVVKDLQRVVQDTFPKTIQFQVCLPRDLWPVVGDPTQLYQVLLNLCLNARDAMPQGGNLTVTMENALLDEQYTAMNPEAKAGPHVLVTVADTGTGITEEVKSRLFEPFFTTKEPGKGTGLGLSTTLSIAKGHGGFVQVLSEPHKGSAFKVYLPAEPGAEAEALPAGPEGPPRGHGELILVVDDEATIRCVCQRTLERHGYQVLTASQGAEAVALYAQHRAGIAAVLTDMIMPVMDGPATIQALRSLEPQVRIVVMSGQASEDAAKAVAGSLRATLAKPFTATELLVTVAQALA